MIVGTGESTLDEDVRLTAAVATRRRGLDGGRSSNIGECLFGHLQHAWEMTRTPHQSDREARGLSTTIDGTEACEQSIMTESAGSLETDVCQ